jgi:glyoxylase-like metal-dependent hydrolase (beta-lactamase superfamily II)
VSGRSDSPEGHPEILRIVAPNPGPMTLEGTNTYVVGEAPAYVIDPGPADKGHVAAIVSAGEQRGGLGGVLLTHSHADHAAAAPLLDAPVIETGPFHVVPTPGHAGDHVCFVADRVCFTGDLILGEGSSIVPPDGGSLAAYLESLRRVRELDLELLCPGHGPYLTDPKAKVDEYIDHRLERERKLVAALETGERSRARLLDLAWDDVPAEMRPVAALAMQAHLEKLEGEGRLPDGLRD